MFAPTAQIARRGARGRAAGIPAGPLHERSCSYRRCTVAPSALYEAAGRPHGGQPVMNWPSDGGGRIFPRPGGKVRDPATGEPSTFIAVWLPAPTLGGVAAARLRGPKGWQADRSNRVRPAIAHVG